MDPKLNVVTDEHMKKADELLKEMRKANRMSASDWLTAVIVIGGFVTPLAVVLWRWALS